MNIKSSPAAVQGAAFRAVYVAVARAVSGAVGRAVEGAVNRAVEGAVNRAVDGAVDGAVYRAIRHQPPHPNIDLLANEVRRSRGVQREPQVESR